MLKVTFKSLGNKKNYYDKDQPQKLPPKNLPVHKIIQKVTATVWCSI